MSPDIENLLYNPMTAEFRQNPYPFYHELREKDPIHWSPFFKCWIIARYQDAMTILQSDHFGVQSFQNSENCLTAKMMQTWFASKNPPVHTSMRHMINKEFTPKKIKRLQPFIQEYSNQLIDQLQTSFDFLTAIAYPLPIAAMSRLLGIPVEDSQLIRGWTSSILQLMEAVFRRMPVQGKEQALEEMSNYLLKLIQKRRVHLEDDVLSYLITQNEVPLSDEDLVANSFSFILGGIETTASSIGNAMLALLQHPQQYQKLQKNSALLESAVEETLRYEAPVQRMSRVVLQETTVGDKLLRQGDTVLILVGSVNRDPNKFVDPDQFNIERKSNNHLTFGLGRHFCLGANLARLENQVIIDLVMQRLPNLELVNKQVQYRNSVSFRILENLLINKPN